MKKLLHSEYDKTSVHSFHVHKFFKDDAVLKKDIIHEAGNVLNIISYKSIVTPLHTDPFDQRFNLVIKRIIDIFFAVSGILFILSWLIPIIAVLIKLDSKGPVFFLQKRNKKNGRIFTCIKFRSMIINEEADLKQTCDNDTRITRIGRYLRIKYLDELPQFFNVLLGDMSIIGPRPHMVSDNLRYNELIPHYICRNKIKPGITGLAQVMGFVGATHDIEQMQNRVNMDIFYIRHWSIKLDFAILCHSMRKILG